MNKSISLVCIVLIATLLGACTPAALAPASTPALPPTSTPAAASPKTAVPTPAADGSRPLAQIPPAQRANRFSEPAATWIKPGVSYVATIITAKGNIVAELYTDTPASVNNFVTLARNGFYDGLTFHRVEPGFVIQGGDPNGDGSGGPGYTIPAEIKHTHPRGALAWARTGDEVNPQRRSSGSQFYITLDETSFLNGAYTVFGLVIEGMTVADQIKAGDKIERIEIAETQVSRLPTPTPTPAPKAPKFEEGRPLAKLSLPERENLYNTPPALTINPAKTYRATIQTAKGDIVVDLDAAGTPNAVNNFILLANLGYYDGMPVAFADPDDPEVIFAIFGSPAGDPSSHVGYNLAAEITPSEVVTGSLVLWWVQDPMTGDILANGSQFAIFKVEVPKGDMPLSIFGKVAEGMEVVNKLSTADEVMKITISEK